MCKSTTFGDAFNRLIKPEKLPILHAIHFALNVDVAISTSLMYTLQT